MVEDSFNRAQGSLKPVSDDQHIRFKEIGVKTLWRGCAVPWHDMSEKRIGRHTFSTWSVVL